MKVSVFVPTAVAGGLVGVVVLLSGSSSASSWLDMAALAIVLRAVAMAFVRMDAAPRLVWKAIAGARYSAIPVVAEPPDVVAEMLRDSLRPLRRNICVTAHPAHIPTVVDVRPWASGRPIRVQTLLDGISDRLPTPDR